ncbi:hypothetical protein C8R41DRAFT_865313 [Lentinula lateritia]|uniref:Uncharacterized protein n=1 Tax=Lentinula lateritia TaxID=40482 RepID=A0ABQ8VTI3_9AGAR|nr:hypothetical protein C8R41DRAFT_865313 [Lentinula lateritia]
MVNSIIKFKLKLKKAMWGIVKSLSGQPTIPDVDMVDEAVAAGSNAQLALRVGIHLGVPSTDESVPKGCVTDGTKLRFADTWDPYLPTIYEVKSHPRIPKDLASNTIKRILVVPWPKGNAPYLKFYFNYCKANVPIPGGRNTTIPSLGKCIPVGDSSI